MATRRAGRVQCIAPWAGGKRSMASRIIAELGPHRRYYELFVGGCAILPQKEQTAESINDANPAIVNVLRQLRDFPATLLAGLDTVFDREEYQSAGEHLAESSKLGAVTAAAQLIVWWMGPGGLAGTTRKGWFAQRHTNTGGCPAKRWASFKASVPELSRRLQGVEINGEDFRTLPVPDAEDVAIYADPPYLQKSFAYECDFTAQDHRDLAAKLNSYERARIVVSYRDEVGPEGLTLAELYPVERWRRVLLNCSKNMASASGKAKRNVEVLLVNGK